MNTPPPLLPRFDSYTTSSSSSRRRSSSSPPLLLAGPNDTTQIQPMSSDRAAHARTKKVGDFEIGECIGQGSFGDVFFGRNVVTGETRALKRLRKVMDQWNTVVSMRDIQSILRLKPHPNIVTLFEVHHVLSGHVWLVFEHLSVSLHEVILHYYHHRDDHDDDHVNTTSMTTKQQPQENQRLPCSVFSLLPPWIIVRWMRDLLNAVQFLHASNFLHRDLKPENLLLTCATGTLKVADFSLARGIHEAHSQALTTYISTRWYRSPEVLVGMPYGPPMDVFAIGCIFAELWTRQPLFPASSEVDLFHQIVSVLGYPPGMEHFLKRHSLTIPSNESSDSVLKRLQARTEHVMPLDAVQVLAGLVHVDPTQRWTTSQALEHEFFADCTSNLTTPKTADRSSWSTATATTAPSSDQVSGSSSSFLVTPDVEQQQQQQQQQVQLQPPHTIHEVDDEELEAIETELDRLASSVSATRMASIHASNQNHRLELKSTVPPFLKQTNDIEPASRTSFLSTTTKTATTTTTHNLQRIPLRSFSMNSKNENIKIHKSNSKSHGLSDSVTTKTWPSNADESQSLSPASNIRNPYKGNRPVKKRKPICK